MLNATASLLAPKKPVSQRAKPIVFTAPSGREYTWTEKREPTQADFDQLVAHEESLVERSKRGEYLGADSPPAKPQGNVFTRFKDNFESNYGEIPEGKKKLSGKKEPNFFDRAAKMVDDGVGPGGHTKRELAYYDRIRPGDPRATGEEGVPVVDETNVRSSIRAKTEPGKVLNEALGAGSRFVSRLASHGHAAIQKVANTANPGLKPLQTKKRQPTSREALDAKAEHGAPIRSYIAGSVGAENNPVDVWKDPQSGFWDKTMATLQLAGYAVGTGAVVGKVGREISGALRSSTLKTIKGIEEAGDVASKAKILREAELPPSVKNVLKDRIGSGDDFIDEIEADSMTAGRKKLSGKTPKLTPEQALEDAARNYQKAATPKSGGMGTKKRGAAVMADDPVDVIRGIADSVKPGEKAVAIKRGLASVVGNTFDQIKSLGGHGPQIAKELEKVLIDAEAMTATRGFKLKDAVRASFGRVPGLRLSGRRTLGISDDASEALVTKIEHNAQTVKSGRDLEKRLKAGETLTDAENEILKAYQKVFDPKERRVWDEWVKVNDEIAEDGRRFGVLVDRVVDGSKVQHLKGQEAQWIVEGQVHKGKIIDGDEFGIKVDVDGKEVQLGIGEHFQTGSLADPETYFPRELKKGILEKLRNEESGVYKELVDHLIEKGKAKDAAQAREVIKRMMNPAQAVIAGPAQSRLRMARIGVLLPDHFYNRNFLEVAERHIARSAMDIASAKIWGPQSKKLGDLLDDTLTAGDAIAINAKLKAAFGRDPLGAIDGPGRAVAATEGLVQAVTKLTGVLTGIRQLSQLSSSTSILGGKAVAKGFFDAAKSLVTGRARLDMVKLSGVIDQDVLSLVGFDDLPGVSKTIANAALTPVRLFDRTLRVHGALSGIAAFEDAIKHLKLVNGVVKRDATYRMLADWFDFTDDDIIRIAKGEKTPADIRQAMAGGVKTQVRVRPVDLPSIAGHPTGKILMRLQTFNYGQARIFGWTVKEATKGNPVPLIRLVAASGVLGEGLVDLVDEITRRIKNEKRPPRWTELKKINSVGDIASRAFDNMIESGSFGLYGVPVSAVKKPFARPLPPTVNSAINLFQSLAYGESSEKEFLKKLEAAGMEFTTKEIVALGQLYKWTHKGKTYRQQNPKPKKD